MKTILKTGLILSILILIIFVYGFFIEGTPNYIFYTSVSFISIIAIIVIKNLKWLKDNIVPSIFIVACVCLFCSGVYLFTNNCFDTIRTRSYEAVVVDYPGSSWYETILWFKTPEGEEKADVKYFKLIDFEDYNIGDKIVVDEYAGVFGIEHYKIHKFDSGANP